MLRLSWGSSLAPSLAAVHFVPVLLLLCELLAGGASPLAADVSDVVFLHDSFSPLFASASRRVAATRSGK